MIEPLQFGNEPPRDWREHTEPTTPKEEEGESEDATPEEKEFVKATLGFDPAELFSDED